MSAFIKPLIKTLTLSLIFSGPFSFAKEKSSPPLTIYTYNSFTNSYGAGPEIKKLFEQENANCTIKYVPFSDGTTILNRLRLEGKNSKANLVVGLDSFSENIAEKTGLFTKSAVDLKNISLPFKWQNTTFIPYDYAQLAFIYDKNKVKNPPTSLRDLIKRKDLNVIYQDPRTSLIGRAFLVWMNQEFSQDEIKQAWQKLSEHTVTVSRGWTEGYGAFLKGESDIVISVNTSPLFHKLQENNDNYRAVQTKEKGQLQIELAAKVKQNPQQCADKFIDFLISPKAQAIIVNHNIMLPVIKSDRIDENYRKLQHKKSKIEENGPKKRGNADPQDSLRSQGCFRQRHRR